MTGAIGNEVDQSTHLDPIYCADSEWKEILFANITIENLFLN